MARYCRIYGGIDLIKSQRSLIVIFAWECSEMHLYKDVGAFPYYLSKYHAWRTSLAYFSDKPFLNGEYEKYTDLVHLGNAKSSLERREVIKQYVREHHDAIDVIMMYSNGRETYKIANFCEKANYNIKFYCKLDMSDVGLARFYDGTLLKRIKNLAEWRKHRNVDLFTVENRSYYDRLKNICVFKNKIEYLPNGVSLLGVDTLKLDMLKKENIILTCGRLGIEVKNNELLIDAVCLLPKEMLAGWKVYLVGPYTDEIYAYAENKMRWHEHLRNVIVFTGGISDRAALYELYARSKIFTLTSRRESFGIVTVEAMYFGAYPVLTNFGPIAEEIAGRVGRVVENHNPEKLKDALVEAINKWHKDDLSDGIKKEARGRFSYKVLSDRLNAILS